jgi:hypothetical protein
VAHLCRRPGAERGWRRHLLGHTTIIHMAIQSAQNEGMARSAVSVKRVKVEGGSLPLFFLAGPLVERGYARSISVRRREGQRSERTFGWKWASSVSPRAWCSLAIFIASSGASRAKSGAAGLFCARSAWCQGDESGRTSAPFRRNPCARVVRTLDRCARVRPYAVGRTGGERTQEA